MIRPASAADVDDIVKLGARFYREAGWQDILEWNEGDCRQSISNMVDNKDCIVIVSDNDGVDGMVGGITAPIYFNYAHRGGEELFWWVKPTAPARTGLLLLEALETAARALGCQSWTMKSLDKVNPERMDRLYRMRGYRATEHFYMKRL